MRIILPLLICCGICSLLSARAEAAAKPILDYLSNSAYGTLAPIEPQGYFTLGRRYVHPPRVEWAAVKDAARYEILLVQGDQVLGITSATSSPQFADVGWDKARPGKAAVIIQAFDASGKRIALSRFFPLYVAPDFDPRRSSKAKRTYKEATALTFGALCDWRFPANVAVPKDGPAASIQQIVLTAVVTPNSCAPLAWPSLHDWLYVDMLVSMSKNADTALKAKILSFARSVGDHYLMSQVTDEGFVYRYMLRGCIDFKGEATLGMHVADPVKKEKMMRLVEPGKCGYSGAALVKIYELTGDSKYLDAAVNMAETLVRTQREDGSWAARVDAKSGEVIGDYSTSAISVASFLDSLNKHRPDTRWTKASKRAVSWIMQNPVKTYGWVVNYDDGGAPATKANPFLGNLSNWDLFEFVRYAAAHPDAVPNAAACVDEQLAWADNHFVFYGSDPLLPIEPFYPCCAEQGNPASFVAAGGCWVPMDFHTANWASALISAYRLTGKQIYLDKAKAAANTLTQYQLDNGRTMTWMCDRTFGVSAHAAGNSATSFWPAAWAMSACVWSELDNMK